MRCIALLAAAAIGIGGCGCEEMMPPLPSPVDGEGSFAGTWQSSSGESCPLRFQLNLKDGGLLKADVNASLRPSFCFAGAPAALTVLPEQQLSGSVDLAGALSLNQPDLEPGCAAPACITMNFLGQGEDSSGDSVVDSYSGTWTASALLRDGTITSYAGTFQVTRQ